MTGAACFFYTFWQLLQMYNMVLKVKKWQPLSLKQYLLMHLFTEFVLICLCSFLLNCSLILFYFFGYRSWRRESWGSSAPLWCFSPSAWVTGVDWHQLKVRACSPNQRMSLLKASSNSYEFACLIHTTSNIMLWIFKGTVERVVSPLLIFSRHLLTFMPF